MASEPESKKFGTEKSLGTGIEKIWYQKKSRSRNRKKLVPKKSLGTGLEKYWYRKKSQNRSRKNLVPKKKSRNRYRSDFGSRHTLEHMNMSLRTQIGPETPQAKTFKI